VDGGGLDDLLGLVLIGREIETRKWLVWAKAWAHEVVLTRRKEIAPRLRDFEKDGDLTIVQRPGQDIVAVADILCKVRDAGLLPEKNAIGVDRHGIGALISELESPGRDFQADQIQGIPQGYQLMGAIKDTERMLAGGDMQHGGSPLMNWCVGNARVEPKGNAILITKAISGSAKIDPLMALFDAAALMALNPEGLGASFWETERTVA
jgi:phage terminase large subunit-like protein